MSPREYIPGDTVFAKLKGYPWWPARVENDKDLPEKVLKQKGKSKGLLYTVFFYGSRDYGFFGPDCVRPFDRAIVERDLKAKKFKTKDLEVAIHQALDPSILKAEEEAEAAAAEEEEDDESDEEEDEEVKNVKPKGRERRKPVATATDKKKKPSTATKKKTTAAKKRISEDDEEIEEAVAKPKKSIQGSTSSHKKKAVTGGNERNKRARIADSESTSDSDKKKRRKSLSTEQEEDGRNKRESSAMSRKSEEPNSHGQPMELEAFKKTSEYKKIYHFRHKLQKLVYEKKAGEIPKEDFTKVSQVVKEIEDSQMTFDLLRYTKIGKVVKFACSYNYGEEDEFKINQRCQQLMKNWKSLILPEQQQA